MTLKSGSAAGKKMDSAGEKFLRQKLTKKAVTLKDIGSSTNSAPFSTIYTKAAAKRKKTLFLGHALTLSPCCMKSIRG